jgi:hypothetical protein
VHQSLSAAATGGNSRGTSALTIPSTCTGANDIHSRMDTPSQIMSSLALGVSVATFGWVHLRKVDAVICTLIGTDLEKEGAVFQFSFANLGTRAVLVNSVNVQIFINPALTGKFMARCTTIGNKLPQIIKPGEMAATTIRSNWDITFLCDAAKEAEKRAEEIASFFFVATVVARNPKGKQMSASKQVAILETNHKNTSSQFQPCEAVFKLRKSH